MTINHLNQAIADCNNGLIQFNLGSPRSFLFENKWYPLHAVYNYASGLANQPNDIPVDSALTLLLRDLLPYTRIKNVAFNNHLPVPLTDAEKLEESRNLSMMLSQLLQ
jgi:hypothetical protein